MPEATEDVPRLKFSTLDLNIRDQFDAWKQLTSLAADVTIDRPAANGFHGQFSAFDLNGINVVHWATEPLCFRRTADHIRSKNLDHWALCFVRQGQLFSESDNREIKAQTGDLMVQSYVRPWTGKLHGRDFVSVHLARDKFNHLGTALENLNHHQLSRPLSGLLKKFLSTLVDDTPRIDEDRLKVLSNSLSDLLSALLIPTAENLLNASDTLNAGKLAIAQEFIQKHLDRPELTPDFICKSLGISKRNLYNIFEIHGGVAKYIKNVRLQSCYTALTDQTDIRLVSTIAYQYGFTSMPLFSRQFKAKYGFSPREARELSPANLAGFQTTSETLLDHLTRVAKKYRKTT